MLRRALISTFRHDGFYLAQSSAYSAMVALFPALLFSAAMIAQLPDFTPLKYELGDFFDQVLPSDVFPLLTSYFAVAPHSGHTGRALWVSALVSLSGASSVLTTLMEGIRRAYGLPPSAWNFWRRRLRALLLVPLCLLPLLLATLLVMFGQSMARWLTEFLAQAIQPAFLAVALAVRWTIALGGVVGLTALIYCAGVPHPGRQHTGQERPAGTTPSPTLGGALAAALPGALVATLMWFVTTLIFGWYVTRFANYSEIYGSLGAAIALLFWLFLVFLSVLCGAEFNAHWMSATPLPARRDEVSGTA